MAPLAEAPAAATEGPNRFTAVDLPTYQTDGVVFTTAAARGLVFVGGEFTSVRPPDGSAGATLPRANFAVFDAATGQPASCAPGFTLPSMPSEGTVRSLNVSPDQQTLYVGGFFSHVNGVPRGHLAAIDIATCTLITAFGPTPNGMVRAIQATSSTVYYGGSFGSVNGVTRKRAAAAGAVGSANPGALLGWAPSFEAPPTFDDSVRALALRPDGTAVVVGGAFDTVNGSDSNALAVVNPTSGAIIRTYPGFIESRSKVMDLAVDSGGFYTANEGTGPSAFDGRIALDWSTYNQRWRDGCLGATQALVAYAGILYSGSHAHDCLSIGAFPDGERKHLLAQTTAAPTTLLPWIPDTNDGIGESLGPRDMVAASTASGDFLWVVGEFTQVNRRNQQGLTRFGQTAQTAGPSAPQVTLSSPAPGQARVAWRASVDNDDSTLSYRVYRDGGSTPIFTTTAKSWFWERRQMTFLDSGLAPGSVHSYRVTASDATNTTTSATRSVTVQSTSSAYASRVLADGASFLWRYDDPIEGLVSDASANNNNGALRGGRVAAVAGAISGDASGALSMPGGPALPGGRVVGEGTIYSEARYSPPTAFTAETWFKTSTTLGGKILGFGTTQILNSWDSDRHVYMRNDGKLTFGAGPDGVLLTTSAAYNDGQWHHVAASQGPAGMALYVDGALQGSNSYTTGRRYEHSHFGGYWRVGGDNLQYWPGEPSNYYWQGVLDETAVYPSALSAATIAQHYQLGTTGSAPGDLSPPSTPTGVVTSVSGSQVTVSWNASSDNVGVTGYDVHRSASSGFAPSPATLVASVGSTSFADGPLPVGTWYYRVIAKDAAGFQSPASAQASAVIAPTADPPPTSPTDVATTVSASTVTVSWAASSDNAGVTGYDVHRSATPDFTPSSANRVGSTGSTTFADQGVPVGTWYYRVVAKDTGGNVSAPSATAGAVVAGVAAAPAPAAPPPPVPAPPAPAPDTAQQVATPTPLAVGEAVHASAISVAGSTRNVTYGRSATHRVTLRRSGTQAALGSQVLRLYHRVVGTSRWTRACTRTTSVTGQASCVTKPTRSRVYQWRFAGSSDQAATTTAYVVRMHPKVTAKPSATRVAQGSRVTISGSVAPNHARQMVYLHRYYRGAWRTTARAYLSRTSTYTFRIRPGYTSSYRVYKTGDRDNSWGISPTRRIVVR